MIIIINNNNNSNNNNIYPQDGANLCPQECGPSATPVF